MVKEKRASASVGAMRAPASASAATIPRFMPSLPRLARPDEMRPPHSRTIVGRAALHNETRRSKHHDGPHLHSSPQCLAAVDALLDLRLELGRPEGVPVLAAAIEQRTLAAAREILEPAQRLLLGAGAGRHGDIDGK